MPEQLSCCNPWRWSVDRAWSLRRISPQSMFSLCSVWIWKGWPCLPSHCSGPSSDSIQPDPQQRQSFPVASEQKRRASRSLEPPNWKFLSLSGLCYPGSLVKTVYSKFSPNYSTGSSSCSRSSHTAAPRWDAASGWGCLATRLCIFGRQKLLFLSHRCANVIIDWSRAQTRDRSGSWYSKISGQEDFKLRTWEKGIGVEGGGREWPGTVWVR